MKYFTDIVPFWDIDVASQDTDQVRLWGLWVQGQGHCY